MSNNTRNGRHSTVNQYYVTDANENLIVTTTNSRSEARTAKRNLIKTFNLKNTDVKITQVTTSIVR